MLLTSDDPIQDARAELRRGCSAGIKDLRFGALVDADKFVQPPQPDDWRAPASFATPPTLGGSATCKSVAQESEGTRRVPGRARRSGAVPGSVGRCGQRHFRPAL